MRSAAAFVLSATVLLAAPAVAQAESTAATEEETLRRIFNEALVHGEAYENLRTLVTATPGRLSGSKNLERAIAWAEQTLGKLQLDRVAKQEVLVPHWERGEKETVTLLAGGESLPLAAAALGNSGATAPGGLVAEVIEVKSLDELAALGREKIAGRIVFFNRPMDPTPINTGAAYSGAGDQRNRGPAAAEKFGAAAVLTRSLTLSRDDVPHTGNTRFAPEQPHLPAAALSVLAAEKLSAALAAAAQGGASVRVALKIHAQTHPDARSHNVIGEIRGREFPDEILLVGGHLDSWDIAPGAHDDGAGVTQSMEVLRIFRALGLQPRHTVRCVLFTNEENGLRGATAYVSAARERQEKHLLALETDNGGFQPRGFNLGSTQGEVHLRAARWRRLFEPYGLYAFTKGKGGADVEPLLVLGATVGELTPDSQRYFDYHHTAIDSFDKVNARELHLGAAALAALIWLVDTQGL
jgi:Zn-dependent M28 family amino/carboxypeptidase